MINYIVNFDEMEEGLRNILSNVTRKRTIGYEKIENTTILLEIPPIRKPFSYERDNFPPNARLKETIVLSDGFDLEDSFEIFLNGESLGEQKMNHTIAREGFPDLELRSIALNYHNNSGKYKKVRLLVLFSLKRGIE